MTNASVQSLEELLYSTPQSADDLKVELQRVTLERDEAQAKLHALSELQETVSQRLSERTQIVQEIAQLSQELQAERRVTEAYRQLITVYRQQYKPYGD